MAGVATFPYMPVSPMNDVRGASATGLSKQHKQELIVHSTKPVVIDKDSTEKGWTFNVCRLSMASCFREGPDPGNQCGD
jgi:hypothetical protein